uniref:Stromal cell-derived factor 2 n=1 Tax=Cacopsylla melanoneura TaxID=428564 RepID=A0A8D9BMH6_9HEMI
MSSSKRLSIIPILVLFLVEYSTAKARSNQYVTCGSVVKLMNVDYRVRLHSHDVKYGTGSGQQSVTGTELKEDVNSHWTIKAATGKTCPRGEAIKCNDIIRLTHTSSNKNLHSHHFASPLSGAQEVSAYGKDGEGDTGDHWKVMCDTEFWDRKEAVQLYHVDTKAYLSASRQTYGRPISGQYEIVAVTWPDHNPVLWKTMEGVFLHSSQPMASKHVHSEL